MGKHPIPVVFTIESGSSDVHSWFLAVAVGSDDGLFQFCSLAFHTSLFGIEVKV